MSVFKQTLLIIIAVLAIVFNVFIAVMPVFLLTLLFTSTTYIMNESQLDDIDCDYYDLGTH